MVIDDLDVEGVALVERQAAAPARVHGHRPLPLPVAFQLVQADAPERAAIVQRLGNVQGEQQIDGMVEIEAAQLVRLLALPDLARRRIPPRPDHGNIAVAGGCPGPPPARKAAD